MQPNDLSICSELHQAIVALENSIEQNLDLARDFSQHIYPDLEINRWNIPSSLPEVSPTQALKLLGHLDQTPILHHPSLHTTRMKPGNDFKISNLALHESSLGPVAELEIFNGLDVALKLTGPSLFLKAAKAELQKRIGRSWHESALKISVPTDAALVKAQLAEILRMIHEQFRNTKVCIDLMDKIFCYLLQISPSFEDDKAMQMIRRHLRPEETKITLEQRPVTEIKQEGFAAPRGILQ